MRAVPLPIRGVHLAVAGGGVAISPNYDGASPRLLAFFTAWRLQAIGYTAAAAQVALIVLAYKAGTWLVSSKGMPLYKDFTCAFTAGLAALHGETALIYNPVEFIKAQDTIVGSGNSLYNVWPYPPTFFLVLAPLAMLPYIAAFLTFNFVTLLGYVSAVYSIVRRSPAIALVLGLPFTWHNFVNGSMSFLASSLLGAALVFLERRPVLAGVFIGCLTFKPHWGILLPVALIASRQWRAFASAAIVATLLASASMVAFGAGAWEAFPREVVVQAGVNLSDHPDLLQLRYDPREYWGDYQTIFGLVRALQGSAVAAWLDQGIATCGVSIIVWFVWRSPVRYSLKAATLSAAILLATPYGYSTDMNVIAIAVAFLVRDHMQSGLSRGEELLLLAALGISLTCNFRLVPPGPVVMMTLLGVILHRALCQGRQLCSVGTPNAPGLQSPLSS
jgi:arabinofuranan 3-O-arabinosyltransferase